MTFLTIYNFLHFFKIYCLKKNCVTKYKYSWFEIRYLVITISIKNISNRLDKKNFIFKLSYISLNLLNNNLIAN